MAKQVFHGWEFPFAKTPAPNERFLRLIASAETNGYDKATVLLVHLPPLGTTGLHTHPDSDEIIFVTGRGEGTVAGEKTRLEADSVIIAPKGVEHQCHNTSETETLKLYCVFVPPMKLSPTLQELAKPTKEYLAKKK